MTTEMPEYNRRVSDARLIALEETLGTLCDSMLEAHVSGMHPDMDGDAVTELIESREAKLSDLETGFGRVVEMLEGKTIRSELNGEKIGHEDGVVQKLDQVLASTSIVEERTNGGVTVTQTIKPVLTARQKGYVWGFAGTVVASLITSMAAIIAVAIGG